MSGSLTQNGEVRLAYEVRGAGDAVLSIHGLGYGRLGWGPLLGCSREDFRVVLFDNRGVGESDVPEGPYTVAQMAEDALAVLDAAGAERAHVARRQPRRLHRAGARADHPERVEKSRAPVDGARRPATRSRCRSRRSRRSAASRRMPREPGCECWSRTRSASTACATARARRGDLRATGSATRRRSRAGRRRSPRADLPRARPPRGDRQPTLVLHGGADNVVDPRNAGCSRSGSRTRALELFPTAGHLLMLGGARAARRHVEEFLA